MYLEFISNCLGSEQDLKKAEELKKLEKVTEALMSTQNKTEYMHNLFRIEENLDVEEGKLYRQTKELNNTIDQFD